MTGQTIILKTCKLSIPLNISGFTKVADLVKENGLSLAKVVENLKNAIKKTGIYQEDGLTEKSVKSALLQNRLKQEKFLLRMVGSVKIIQEKTRVYNLSIEGVPAFDTLIGLSHNTQKPVKLLEQLIEIFTDKGDVVIDPCAGSGSTLLAAAQCDRRSYGFEIKKNFYKESTEKVLSNIQRKLF